MLLKNMKPKSSWTIYSQICIALSSLSILNASGTLLYENLGNLLISMLNSCVA